MTRGQKATLGCLGVPILIVLVIAVSVQVSISNEGNKLEGELQRAKSLGLVTEPSELVRGVPPEENAAEEYKHAILLAGLQPVSAPSSMAQDLRLVTGSPGPKEQPLVMTPEVLAAYGRLKPLYDLLDQATDKPHLEFRRDWSQGFAMLLPEYAQARQFAKAYAFRAELQQQHGQVDASLKTVKRISHLGDQLGEEPILIAVLVDVAIQMMACAEIDRIVRAHSREPATLAQAKTTLASFGPLPNMRYALNGEMVAGRVGIQSLANIRPSQLAGEFGSGSNGYNPVDLLAKSASMRKAWEARAVDAYVWQLEHLPKDPAKWREARDVELQLERKISSQNSIFDVLNQIIIPIFSQSPIAIGRVQAVRRVSATSIEIFEARNRTGSLPASIANLGAISEDPFSTGLLKYQPKGAGFIVYSIGPNEKDDHGLTTSSNGDDIVTHMD